MDPVVSSKHAAGLAAAKLVRDGMTLGLGTGSTVAHFLNALSKRIHEEGLSVKGVATSERTTRTAQDLGIPLTTLEEVSELDLVVDGADEVDSELRLIKGGGGALLREKIVAAAARKVVIVVGEGKRVERLGTTFHLPVEIVPFGHRVTMRKVAECRCQPFLRTSEAGTPAVTDNGNYILDCKFAKGISSPERLHSRLSQIPGVVELGLFLGLCHLVIEGRAQGGTRSFKRSS